MHGVTEALAYLFTDVLPDADDVTWGSHLHNLAVVRDTVESGVNQQATFAEESFDVMLWSATLRSERYLHVGGIHILVLQDHCVEFQFCDGIGHRANFLMSRKSTKNVV